MSPGKPTRSELLQEAASLRTRAERELDVTVRLLRLVNSSHDLHDLMREATQLLAEWSGCHAVGIRLRDGDDFPYFETRGFPPQFMQAENTLCVHDCDGQLARDCQGNAMLACMCGNILCGRFDATLPFFTPGGSFWTNSTTELLASTTEADRQARTRNRCNSEGYESVALIPLLSGGSTLGLMQFNDRRRGRFTTRLIELLENLGHALAESIARRAIATESGSLLAIERDLAAALSRAQGVEEVIQRTLRAALDATGLDCGGVYLRDESTKELHLACHVGLSPEFARAGAVFGQETERSQVVESGQLVEIDGELLMSPAFDDVRREGVHAVIVAPVTHEGQNIACLNMGSRTANRIAPHARNAVEAITALMGVALARVRAAASLRQSQAELRAVYDNSPIMMCVLDSQSCFLYMNRTMSEFVGKTEQELKHQRAGGIIGCVNALEDPHGCGHGTDCQACTLRQALEDTLATGRNHGGIERIMTLERRDGRREVALVGATALIQTASGKSLLVCLEDVTERKRAEEKLRLQAMVLDQIADRVTVTDLEGRITYVNDAQCLGFQRTRDQLVGLSVTCFGEDLQRGATQREIIEKTLQYGQWRGEVVYCTAGGGEIILDCRTQLVRNDAGRPCALCGISTDITRQLADEHRLADMQLQLHHTSRLAAMGELAAGIAHEVNQPLCSIVNFANACRNIARGDSAEWGQIRTWSDAIAASAAQAGDIIRRLISFARRPQADREDVRVQQLFDDSILLIQHEARTNRVAVRLAMSDPGLTVHAQPVPIRQVMVNLLRNSIDALGTAPSIPPQGPLRNVLVQAARIAEGVEITVVDNGPGVPESDLPKAFEPFFTTKSQGLGLGLVISKTIVEDHGGRIWATTNRDGGLSVHFILPAGRD